MHKYVNKKLLVTLNGRRKVSGLVVGHDKYMNIVLDNSHEVLNNGETKFMGTTVLRGNSIIMWECLDQVQ